MQPTIRAQYDDPAHAAALSHCRSSANAGIDQAGKEDIRMSDRKLIADGKWYPPSYRQNEIQPLRDIAGCRIAAERLGLSRSPEDSHAQRFTDRCVVLCELGGTPVYGNTGDLEVPSAEERSVRFRDRLTRVCLYGLWH